MSSNQHANIRSLQDGFFKVLATVAVCGCVVLGASHFASGQDGNSTDSRANADALDTPMNSIATCDVSELAYQIMNSPEFIEQRRVEEDRLARETRKQQTAAITESVSASEQTAKGVAAAAVLQSTRNEEFMVGQFRASQLREAFARITRAVRTVAEREQYTYVFTGRSDVDFLGLDPRNVYIALGQSTLLYGPSGSDITDAVRRELGLPKQTVVPAPESE